MKIEKFEMERQQSTWENRVEYNLSESGVHPFTLEELLSDMARDLFSVRLGYGQSNGPEKLREAIAALYPGAGVDNVLVTNGSAEANFLSIWRGVEKGDEFVLMLPNYMQIWGISRGFGAEVKPWWLREELNWAPDLDELKNLVTDKTRIIAICNPNNPTGAVLSDEAMKTIVNIADSVGAWIYVDEVYRGAEIAGGKETSTFFGMYDKVIAVCGLSKAYALPGLRIGWLVAPGDTTEDLWSYSDYTSISSGMLSTEIAALALQPEKRAKILKRNRGILRENLDFLQSWIDSHGGKFSLIPPKAGGIAYVSYNMNINSTELMLKARNEKSVFIVPGDHFLMDKYIRIGIGSEKEYINKALSLFDEVLEGIK
ncbi:aminotransferase class I/II-fold pyridoxal phosphate-dependent enzyme [candidate division KSB1 bacterium]